MKEKVLNLLGMAQKAGALASGDFMVEKALKKGKVHLLFLGSDTAKNNSEKYQFLSANHNVLICQDFTKEEMGAAIGKERRVVIAVLDKGFAQAIHKLLQNTKQ